MVVRNVTFVGRKQHFSSFLSVNRHRSGWGTQCWRLPFSPGQETDGAQALASMSGPERSRFLSQARGPVLERRRHGLGRAVLPVFAVTPTVEQVETADTERLMPPTTLISPSPPMLPSHGKLSSGRPGLHCFQTHMFCLFSVKVGWLTMSKAFRMARRRVENSKPVFKIQN